MNNPLGGSFINVGDDPVQGGLCCFLITVCNSRADLLDEGAHSGTNMGVAGGANDSLFVTFDC